MKKLLAVLLLISFGFAEINAQQGCADVTWTSTTSGTGPYTHTIFITIDGGTNKKALVFPKCNGVLWPAPISFPQCLVVGSYTYTWTNSDCSGPIGLDFNTFTGANSCTNGSECSCSPNNPLAGSITGGNSPICLGSSTGTMTLSGHSLNTALQWQLSVNGGVWSNISGATSTTTYSSIPPSPGEYEYRVRVSSPCSGGGIVYTNIIKIIVHPVPTVTVNSVSRCSAGPAATITATPSPSTPNPAGSYNYAWSVPSGATNPGNVASFNATIAGTYAVTVTNSGSTCTGTGSGVLTVNPSPTVSVNSPTICASAGSATIAATTSAGSFTYAWTVPGGAPNPGNVANFVATFSGTYTVTVTNTSTSCTGNGSGTFTINPNPACAILGTDAVCANSMSNSYSATVGMSSYAWTISGNGTINGPSNEAVVSINAGTPGSYLLTSTVTNSFGCASSCNKSVTVKVVPATGSIMGGSSPICEGTPTGTMTISGYTPGSTLQWLKNGVPINGETGSSYTDNSPGPAGIYEYRVAVTNNGCTAISSFVSITVNAMPNPGSVTPLDIFVEIPTNTHTGNMTLGNYSGGTILRWQKRLEPSADWTDINTTANPYSDPLTTIGTWHYRAVVQNGACLAYSAENNVYVTQALPQPVELMYFTANQIQRAVALSWSTASEADNEGFSIERSSDGVGWKQLEFIAGHGTTNETQVYAYMDTAPLAGTNYYRLSQRDFNGKTEYFKVIAIDMSGLSTPYKLYPNPAQGQLTVVSYGEGTTTLFIYDVFGRVCLTETLTGNEQLISLTDLACGVYQVVFEQNGRRWTEKLLVK